MQFGIEPMCSLCILKSYATAMLREAKCLGYCNGARLYGNLLGTNLNSLPSGMLLRGSQEYKEHIWVSAWYFFWNVGLLLVLPKSWKRIWRGAWLLRNRRKFYHFTSLMCCQSISQARAESVDSRLCSFGTAESIKASYKSRVYIVDEQWHLKIGAVCPYEKVLFGVKNS